VPEETFPNGDVEAYVSRQEKEIIMAFNRFSEVIARLETAIAPLEDAHRAGVASATSAIDTAKVEVAAARDLKAEAIATGDASACTWSQTELEGAFRALRSAESALVAARKPGQALRQGRAELAAARARLTAGESLATRRETAAARERGIGVPLNTPFEGLD
jgi:hypothetical protein